MSFVNKVFIGITAVACLLAQYQPSINTESLSVLGTTPNTPNLQIQYVGTSGPHRSSFYWLVPEYANGDAPVSKPATVTGVTLPLSGSNYITLKWNAMEGSPWYHIYRTETPVFTTTNSYLGSTANTTFTDNGITASSRPLTPIPTKISPTINSKAFYKNPVLNLEWPNVFKGQIWDQGGAVVNVKSFGASGDGIRDDTRWIQSAIDSASGGTIVFPTGTYRITSPLNIPGELTLRGEHGSTIRVVGNINGIVAANVGFVKIHNLRITGDDNATGGNLVLFDNCDYCSIVNSEFRYGYDQVVIINGSNPVDIYATWFFGNDYTRIALRSGRWDANEPLNGNLTLQNVRMYGTGNGLYYVDINNISGLNAIDWQTYGLGTAVALDANKLVENVFITSSAFDSTGYNKASCNWCDGMEIYSVAPGIKVGRIQISNSWFSTNKNHGVVISNYGNTGDVSNIMISNSTIFNNGTDGIRISHCYSSSIYDINISDNRIGANSTTNPGTRWGIVQYADCPVVGFKIHNNYIGQPIDGFTTQQQYGVFLNIADHVSVIGNKFIGDLSTINIPASLDPGTSVFALNDPNVALINPTILPIQTFSGLPANGRIALCTDCQVTSGSDNTCTSGGTGALAVRLNGVWRCFANQN